VTLGLALLRVIGVGALVLVLWNPAVARVEPAGAPPLVLLDASLSLAGHGGQWPRALDTARVLARGGVIWRFGARVTGFDTLPPTDGASRLAPALAAAAARGGPVTVVTDGAITDLADVPPDLAHSPRIVVLPRAPFFDAFVAAVDGPRHVAASDTVRLTVSYGVAGPRPAGRGADRATLTAHLAGRQVAARPVPLPDSGIVATELTFPVARFPPGWSALEVRLEGVPDSEPRDDARIFLLEVSPQPSVVLLASPPDWESRFLARALTEVARVPLRTFVAAEPGGARWRDAATLALVAPADVRQAVAAARLVIEAGDPAAFGRFAPRGALLVWPLARRQDGDWYVEPAGPSPLAGALAGVAWDSLPPATWLSGLTPDPAATVVLTARLARRGAPRPIVVLAEQAGSRRAAIAAGGLYRWAFRGGASAEAYRALVAALTDWLLASGPATADEVVPAAREVPNGTAVAWRWAGPGAPRSVALELVGPRGARIDTLRFDADGRAELRLPAGVYRYAPAAGGQAPRGMRAARAAGLVAVDRYSDEWRPSASVLAPQAGAPAARHVSVGLRERWWLFLVAVAAFAAEWAWRRVVGLP
jgi:hypothetical protein